ncbi:hypothetical protein RUND412_000904 [Rhizina undulata]
MQNRQNKSANAAQTEMDAGSAGSEEIEIVGMAAQPADEMVVDAVAIVSEKPTGVGVAAQTTTKAQEEPSVEPQTRLGAKWCKNSEAREVLGMGVGHDEKYKEFKKFCKKAVDDLGIAFRAKTSPDVWDQLLERVLALEMMAPYVELFRADGKSLESRNVQVAINHLLRLNAKWRGTQQRIGAARARGENPATPRVTRRRPASDAATPGNTAAQTLNLKVEESERLRTQRSKLKALKHKNKRLVLEKKRIKAKYRARYCKLKLKHLDLQGRYNNRPQPQESTERSEMDLELLTLAGLEDGNGQAE